jgi:hypothetical protein
MTTPENICYCGAYGGGMHTKSARCWEVPSQPHHGADSNPKIYLGDGTYAAIEYGDLVLTTENGITTTNRVVLDAHGWETLQRWVASLTPTPREVESLPPRGMP